MLKINYWAVVTAALTAFVMSSLYYSPLLLGSVWSAFDPGATAGMKPSIWMAAVEIFRTLVITYVLARVLALAGGGGWRSTVPLGLWLWFGFSAMMWAGAIMWEKTPWQVAAIHSGDWLLKTLLAAVVLGVWRASERTQVQGPRNRCGLEKENRHGETRWKN